MLVNDLSKEYTLDTIPKLKKVIMNPEMLDGLPHKQQQNNRIIIIY